MRRLALVALLPLACGLPSATLAKIATCAGGYDACYVAATQAPGDNAVKMAAYKACRAQVDAQCLDTPAPADSATVAPSASAAPSAALPAPSAVPSASTAPTAVP